MRQFAAFLIVIGLLGCAHNKEREYSSAAVTLSDFSMKIVAHYKSEKLSVPKGFDAKQFFDILEAKYPDQSRVKYIKEHYKVSACPLDGDFYSVMLCDPNTGKKIMEDLSCHLDRVEIKSWENNAGAPCVFENNWKPYCE